MHVPEANIRHARFWRKFLRLTHGRVTALRALEIIALEENNASLKEVIGSLRQTVESGSSLSAAAGKHPSVFSRSVCELLRTAEKTGAWDEILQEIADGLEDGTFD